MQKTFRILLLLFSFSAAPLHALTLDVIPTLQLLTNIDLSQFDINGTGVTLQMFVLRIDNTGDLNTYTGPSSCRIRYITEYIAGSSKQLLYEGQSNRFDMAPGEIVIERSNEFLIKNNPSAKVSIQYTLQELSDEEFKRRIFDNQTVPNGTLRYRFQLETGSQTLMERSFDITVLNSSTIQLLSPGSEPPGSLPLVGDPNPVFMWTSDLLPGIYGSDDVFEVRVYKARSGESMSEAISRSPVQRIRTSMLQERYPTSGEQLIPGVTYYWEAIGFLKGLTTEEIKSNVYGFKMLKPVNAQVLEVLNLLRLIYDESVIEQVYDYSEDVSIRIDGAEVDIDGLRALVQSILKNEKEIQSTTVR